MTSLISLPSPVLPKRRGVNYNEHVTTYRLEAEVSAIEAHGYDHQQQVYGERLLKGMELRTLAPTKTTLRFHYYRLESERAGVVHSRDQARRRCWFACKQLYSALTHATVPHKRATLDDMGIETCDAPHAIWRVLMGDLDAPGAWPPGRDEEYV